MEMVTGGKPKTDNGLAIAISTQVFTGMHTISAKLPSNISWHQLSLSIILLYQASSNSMNFCVNYRGSDQPLFYEELRVWFRCDNQREK